MANDAPTTDTPAVDFGELLERERAELRKELAELGHGESDRLKYDPNFADSSQVTAERGEAENLARDLRDSLAEVEAAISRLESGTYGNCERCGKPIASARLEAMPAARLCITCASRS